MESRISVGRVTFDDLPVAFTDKHGNTATGRAFVGKNFTYYLEWSYVKGSASYAKPNTGEDITFNLADGVRHCRGAYNLDACKKFGFSRSGIGCTSGSGAYLEEGNTCLVE